MERDIFPMNDFSAMCVCECVLDREREKGPLQHLQRVSVYMCVCVCVAFIAIEFVSERKKRRESVWIQFGLRKRLFVCESACFSV